MHRVAVLICGLLLLLTAAPAAAINVEDIPDYWGAAGFGPVWFDDAGWGVYAQGGYYFTSWLGLGLAVDWSIDAQESEDLYTRKQPYVEGQSWVEKHWEYSRRRQWFPAADLRFRFPIHELFSTCIDLGVGVMIDDTLKREEDRITRNDNTSHTEEDTSEPGEDGAFLFRPAVVFKIWKVALGYRFFVLSDGSDPGHMVSLGIDWDI